jgi:hypothetical protein
VLRSRVTSIDLERCQVHLNDEGPQTKHPATIYRWIASYNCSGRLSELLRKNRADRGKSRLSSKVDTIIEDAIKKIYLTAEEVNLQCFKAGLKKPAANTVRRRIATLSDRLKLEKRKGKKAAAEKYEPIKGHFPGADFPLAVESDTAVLSLPGSSSAGDFLTYNIAQIGKSPLIGPLIVRHTPIK